MEHDDDPPGLERRPMPPAWADGPALELSLAKTLRALRAVTSHDLDGIEPAHGAQWIAAGSGSGVGPEGSA